MRPCFICESVDLCAHREEGLIGLYVAAAEVLRVPKKEEQTNVNGTSKTRIH